MKVETEDSTSYETFSLGRIQAVEPFIIQPGETKLVPFRLKLNDETPVTALNAKNESMSRVGRNQPRYRLRD